jgi:hypothetical protein
MIKPYTAVGLVPTIRGIRSRKDIKINLEHLKHLTKAANWLSGFYKDPLCDHHCYVERVVRAPLTHHV